MQQGMHTRTVILFRADNAPVRRSQDVQVSCRLKPVVGQGVKIDDAELAGWRDFLPRLSVFPSRIRRKSSQSGKVICF